MPARSSLKLFFKVSLLAQVRHKPVPHQRIHDRLPRRQFGCTCCADMPTHMSAHMSTHMATHMCMRLAIHMAMHMSMRACVHIFVYDRFAQCLATHPRTTCLWHRWLAGMAHGVLPWRMGSCHGAWG